MLEHKHIHNKLTFWLLCIPLLTLGCELGEAFLLLLGEFLCVATLCLLTLTLRFLCFNPLRSGFGNIFSVETDYFFEVFFFGVVGDDGGGEVCFQSCPPLTLFATLLGEECFVGDTLFFCFLLFFLFNQSRQLAFTELVKLDLRRPTVRFSVVWHQPRRLPLRLRFVHLLHTSNDETGYFLVGEEEEGVGVAFGSFIFKANTDEHPITRAVSFEVGTNGEFKADVRPETAVFTVAPVSTLTHMAKRLATFVLQPVKDERLDEVGECCSHFDGKMLVKIFVFVEVKGEGSVNIVPLLLVQVARHVVGVVEAHAQGVSAFQSRVL